jgi:hypothetical protein
MVEVDPSAHPSILRPVRLRRGSSAGPTIVGSPGVSMIEALVLAALLADGPAPDRGEALRDAARTGDLASVTRLLDAGVPADAKAPRHGQDAAPVRRGEGRLGRPSACWSRAAPTSTRARRSSARRRSARRSAVRAAGGTGRSRSSSCRRERRDAGEALDAAVDTGRRRVGESRARDRTRGAAGARGRAGRGGRGREEEHGSAGSPSRALPRRRRGRAAVRGPARHPDEVRGRYRAGNGPETTVAVRGAACSRSRRRPVPT